MLAEAVLARDFQPGAFAARNIGGKSHRVVDLNGNAGEANGVNREVNRLVWRSPFESDIRHLHVHTFHWGARHASLHSVVVHVFECGIGWELPSGDDSPSAICNTAQHAEVLSDENVGAVVEKESNRRAFERGILQCVEVLAFAVAEVFFVCFLLRAGLETGTSAIRTTGRSSLRALRLSDIEAMCTS